MAPASDTVLHEAEQLIASAQSKVALDLLRAAADSGDASAALYLGKAFLGGKQFGRDLARSRAYFESAANLGDQDALAVHIAFLANGTGGQRDWSTALRLLRRHASQIPDYLNQLQLIERMAIDADGSPVNAPAASESWSSPQATIYRQFLSAAECDYLIEVSTPAFRPSTVIHPQTRRRIADPIRTSAAAAFPLALERPVIHAINRRIASASGTSVAQGEPLQVLRYAPGQQYKLHLDALPGADNQRAATFLIYLNEDYLGGETEFPRAERRFRGERGDALMFRNIRSDGTPDEMAVHAGLPVISGVKHLASRWIRARPLDLCR